MARRDRCVATNAAGGRCLYRADHGNLNHLYPGDPTSDSFRLGQLQYVVKAFLEGGLGRNALAAVLAETEEDRA